MIKPLATCLISMQKIWALLRESLILLLLHVNNNSADQPTHPLSLISAFVIHLLKVSSYDVSLKLASSC